MFEKKSFSAENLESASKIYYLLNDKISNPCQGIDIFDLKEAMAKPLNDEKASLFAPADYDKDKLPLNSIFPFEVINKHIQKLKADPDKKEDHLNTYIFSNKNDNDSVKFLEAMKIDLLGDFCKNYVVNATERRAKIFFDSLVELSKECTFNFETYPSEQQIIKKSRIFLVGSPGIGKTTFLNFLISVYADEISKNKSAIVIRVDLNDAINKKSNIKTLIEQKFYEVFRKYFFPKDYFKLNFEEIKNYVLTKRNINLLDKKNKNYKIVEKNIKDFIKENAKIDLSFISEFMKYLNDVKKVHYIFFIDGLDYITLDEMHDIKFNSWLRQLDNYILTKDAHKGCFLITMRDVSIYRAFQSRTGGTREAFNKPKIVFIEQCDFREMLIKKLDFSKKEIRAKVDYYRDNQKPEYNVYSWIDAEIIESIIKEYLAFISIPFLEDTELIEKISNAQNIFYHDLDPIIKNGLEKIQKITCGNYRCIMRNLTYLLGYFSRSYGFHIDEVERCFLKKSLKERLFLLSSRSYLVLRTFIVGMLDDKGEYRTPYRYRLKQGNDKEIAFIKAGQRFVIPPITNFVHCDQGEIKRQYRGLFKIRFLQFLNNNTTKSISMMKLVDCFNKHFGYVNNEMLKADIEEMLYSQLIYLTDLNAYLHKEDCNLGITELGKFVLENMLYNYIYYATTIDALPMPESLAKNIEPINYYWARTTNLNYYVIQKAVSVLIYLKFLSYCESKEKTNYNFLQARQPGDTRVKFEDNFKNIVSKISKKVQPSIINTFADRLNKDSKGFLNLLKEKYNIEI